MKFVNRHKGILTSQTKNLKPVSDLQAESHGKFLQADNLRQGSEKQGYAHTETAKAYFPRYLDGLRIRSSRSISERRRAASRG